MLNNKGKKQANYIISTINNRRLELAIEIYANQGTSTNKSRLVNEAIMAFLDRKEINARLSKELETIK